MNLHYIQMPRVQLSEIFLYHECKYSKLRINSLRRLRQRWKRRVFKLQDIWLRRTEGYKVSDVDVVASKILLRLQCCQIVKIEGHELLDLK